MDERRRKARTDLQAFLNIKHVRGEGASEVMISVTNVSTSGIGFICEEHLEMGAVYEVHWSSGPRRLFRSLLRSSE